MIKISERLGESVMKRQGINKKLRKLLIGV
jgi:hypothetical protein